MVDKDKERDWDKEMRAVDKLLAKLPNADPTPGRAPVQNPQSGIPTVPDVLPAGRGTARAFASTWLRLGLGLLLGIGMMVWPYSHVCGLRLMFYILGVATLVVAATWSAMVSWKHRQGFAHFLSVLLLIWGLALAAGAVLPRIGYAGQQGLWLCPDP